MKLNKILYYLHSVKLLNSYTNNFTTVISNVLKKSPAIIRFKKGITLKITTFLDLLIIKETIIDDCYKVKNLINPKVIVDIGAGVGDFGIFASYLFPSAKIYCFEPNPKLFVMLKQNVHENLKSKQIICIQSGIGSQETQNILLLAKQGTQSTYIHTYIHRNKLSHQDMLEVKKEPLKKFVAESIDLLKIDCEGAELEILSMFSKKYFRKIKRISLEYHNHIIPNESEKIVHLLKEKSYSVEIVPDRFSPQIGIMHASKINSSS